MLLSLSPISCCSPREPSWHGLRIYILYTCGAFLSHFHCQSLMKEMLSVVCHIRCFYYNWDSYTGLHAGSCWLVCCEIYCPCQLGNYLILLMVIRLEGLYGLSRTTLADSWHVGMESRGQRSPYFQNFSFSLVQKAMDYVELLMSEPQKPSLPTPPKALLHLQVDQQQRKVLFPWLDLRKYYVASMAKALIIWPNTANHEGFIGVDAQTILKCLIA